MPLYKIQCHCCESEQEVYRSFKNIDDLPSCCGEAMHRVPCAPLVMNDIQPYKSMITGEYINSRSRHREHLRDHGCIEIGNEKVKPREMKSPPGLKEEIIKVVKQKTNSL